MHRIPVVRNFASILIFLSLAICGAEQTAASGPLHPEVDLRDGLSEREAVLLGLTRNLELLTLRRTRGVALSGVAEASLLPNPEVRYAWSDLITDDGVGIRRNNVGLRWSPPRPGELSLKAGKARSKVQEADSTRAAAEQRLAADIRVLHRTIVLLKEQVRLSRENERVKEALLETIRAQVQAGVKSALDHNVAEISLADTRAASEQYRSELALQLSRLKSRLELPRGYEIVIQSEGDPLAFQPRPVDREELIARALAHRAEVTVAAERCSQAQLDLQSQSRERYPWLSVVQVNRRFGGNDPGRWGIQFGVDLPVFRWRGEGLQVVSAEVNRCRQEQDEVRAGITAEIEELLVQMDATSASLQQHQEVVAPLIEKNLELSRSALAAGQADALEPLLAQARQISARQTYISKLIDLRTQEVGLDHAVGNPAH